MPDGHFKPVAYSLGIDNGELNGLAGSTCFVLGCQFGHVNQVIAANPDRRLNFTVCMENKHRLEAAIRTSGRHVYWEVPSDDVGEQWIFLTVSAVGETEYEFLEDMRYQDAEDSER